MKKLAIVLIATGSLLSGCIAYDVSDRNQGGYRGDHDHGGDADRVDRDRDGVSDHVDRDRDGDGVRNHQDSRPNDPRRY